MHECHCRARGYYRRWTGSGSELGRACAGADKGTSFVLGDSSMSTMSSVESVIPRRTAMNHPEAAARHCKLAALGVDATGPGLRAQQERLRNSGEQIRIHHSLSLLTGHVTLQDIKLLSRRLLAQVLAANPRRQFREACLIRGAGRGVVANCRGWGETASLGPRIQDQGEQGRRDQRERWLVMMMPFGVLAALQGELGSRGF
ncbi:hypothetical protein BJX62DRAFT_84513 [Aspergillus germanicus]